MQGSLGKGEKKPRKKIDMSEGQCALEKIIMLIITLTGKKKKNKRKRQKSTVDEKKQNYKNSDTHNCNETNQHIVILLENLCSLKFFHVLQDSFKGSHLMEQGYKVNTPANYIHAYNESRFFIIRLLNVISIKILTVSLMGLNRPLEK